MLLFVVRLVDGNDDGVSHQVPAWISVSSIQNDSNAAVHFIGAKCGIEFHL